MQQTVGRFVKSFQKAVRAEMEAMREQQGPFETAVDAVEEVSTPPDSRHRLYDLTLPEPNDKLILNGECTLAHDHGEVLITITAIDGHRLGVRCDDEIPASSAYKLVIYPWFLYERLLHVLESLPTSSRFSAESALTLFGQRLPRTSPMAEGAALPELNDSQRRAVRLCRDSTLAFVWGPPGTGKTRTLGHIVIDLVNQGMRVVVTSTTNAAVDQALARLAGLESARDLMEAGGIVRVGQTDADTFGAGLHEVIRRQNDALRLEIRRLMNRVRDVSAQLSDHRKALAKLAAVSRAAG
jgi:hypothetical protein